MSLYTYLDYDNKTKQKKDQAPWHPRIWGVMLVFRGQERESDASHRMII